MSYMLDEIRQQPAAVSALLVRERRAIERLAAACRARGIELIFVAARGTSDHAAVYAKYLAEIVAGTPVCLAAPSVFTLYGAAPRLDNALVLAISQSGEAVDARAILERARAAGQLTACITNNAGSPLAAAAEHVIDCGAGEEKSLPATKTYTTSLAAVAALVAELAGEARLREELRAVPGWMEAVLESEAVIAPRVERYRYMEECVVLARGFNQCTALETALKLTETSYVLANPYGAADFLHGPIAAVEEGTPCLLYAPSGQTYPQMEELAGKLAEREAELVIISDRVELRERAQTFLPIPGVPEALSPLVAIVVGQLFAYHLATVKGRDPDRPRGLRKVTITQ
jgi:glucosamine--fructose-6-phosphate aminotransferase (isomerizing)